MIDERHQSLSQNFGECIPLIQRSRPFQKHLWTSVSEIAVRCVSRGFGIRFNDLFR
jgi:hypothetical protein